MSTIISDIGCLIDELEQRDHIEEMLMEKIRILLTDRFKKYISSVYVHGTPQCLDCTAKVNKKNLTMRILLLGDEAIAKVSYPFRARANTIPIFDYIKSDFDQEFFMKRLMLLIDRNSGNISIFSSFSVLGLDKLNEEGISHRISVLLDVAAGIYSKVERLSRLDLLDDEKLFYTSILNLAQNALEGKADETASTYGVSYLRPGSTVSSPSLCTIDEMIENEAGD